MATRAPVSRHMRAAALQRRATRPQHPCGGAGRTVVARWIQPPPAPTLVSRTCAQQPAEAFQAVRAPFQYALSTKAGAEALARDLNLATESGSRTTMLSVDGVGAYDHIARAAIFEGLRRDARLEALIPFVRLFMARKAHTSTMMLTGVVTPSSKPKEANKEMH